jgi:hypothetical protein
VVTGLFDVKLSEVKVRTINNENCLNSMNLNKKFLILITFLLSGFSVVSLGQVKITDGVDMTMNANSLLELESVNRGLLIPRVALVSLGQADPLTDPVPTGMLVYSTGGSVPDGFYFWNGSRWVSFNVSETPATKSADATLLKSETLVLASGDITLTLPVVTSADNGLSITIKNIGTYLNLVTIEGNSGATIDGNTETSLTRWRGQTYVAWEGNWITRNKETRTENMLDVSPQGSFNTIPEVIGFLNLHMTGPTVVRLSGEIHEIDATQTIDLPFPVTFQGLSFGETEIDATSGVSGSPMFDCQTECYFKMLTFKAFSNASGNNALNLTGSGTYYEVKDAYFTGFNKAIVSTNNNDLWVFDVDFEDCPGAGIEIAAGTASGGSFKISESDFLQCGKGINLLSGVSETVSILNCTFYNTLSGSDIGVLYTPSTFTSFNSIFITNNAWNNQGTFFSGFDFTRADGRDANVFLSNNAGAGNKNPHCKINVNNNVSTTTVTTAGTFYKANWTNTSFYTTKWIVNNNRITYQTDYLLDAWAIITGNITSTNSNVRITIAIVKNGVTGTRYGETDLRIVTANQPFQFSTVIYIPDMRKNDYLELFATSSQSGDIIRFQDVQWLTNTE